MLDHAKTLPDLILGLEDSAPNNWTFSAIEDCGESITTIENQTLGNRVRAVAGALYSGGVRPGDRVLLILPPDLEFVIGFFGCSLAGSIPVPTYPPDPGRLGPTLRRLESIVADAGARHILTTADFGDAIRTVLGESSPLHGLAWIATDEATEDLATLPIRPTLHPDDIACLQYTSGSTGTPKGVMLTHHNIVSNCSRIISTFGDGGRLAHVSWLPPYHDMGLVAAIATTAYCEGEAYLMSPIEFLKNPVSWLRSITKFSATTSSAPTFAFEVCARKITEEEKVGLDLSSWHAAPIAAEPVRTEVIDAFVKAFEPFGFRRTALGPCYGLAEATLICTGTDNASPLVRTQYSREGIERDGIGRAPDNPSEEACELVSCGRPLNADEVRIVDPESKRALPDGEVGEIWFAGEGVAAGYWNNPTATEETFRAKINGDPSKCFLRTGDLGFLSENLYVTGRIKDLLIIRGRNYYPQDIEATVYSVHPSIRVGCGVAVNVPTSSGDSLVVLQEVTSAASIESSEMKALITRAIFDEHGLHVEDVRILAPRTIAKTSSGKLQRAACRDLYISGAFDEEPAEPDDRIEPPPNSCADTCSGSEQFGQTRPVS